MNALFCGFSIPQLLHFEYSTIPFIFSSTQFSSEKEKSRDKRPALTRKEDIEQKHATILASQLRGLQYYKIKSILRRQYDFISTASWEKIYSVILRRQYRKITSSKAQWEDPPGSR